MKRFKELLICVLIAAVFALPTITYTGCDEADMASHNLSKAADNFEVLRRVVFYNGITNDYILVIEGYCSIYDDGLGQLEVTIKTGMGYKKHFLGLSDNVTYFSEQMDAAHVSKNHYRVVFKPSVILPMIEVK